MLKIEEVVEELNSQLDSSGLFYSEKDNVDEINAKILSTWSSKFGEALKFDFFEQLQLNISLSNEHFELFGDQGATIWTSKITVMDVKTLEKLGLWFRAVVNHRQFKLRLDEMSIRQGDYFGTNFNIKALCNKLMKAQKNGYSSEVAIKECLRS